jgi:hypothetical protein
MSEFEKWWDDLCKEGILIPSHPDKASAQLAWLHQQARIDALSEPTGEMIEAGIEQHRSKKSE